MDGKGEEEQEVESSWTARDGREALLTLLQRPSEEQGGGAAVISVAQPVPVYGDDWSVFPPKEHEDLYAQHEFSVGEPCSSCSDEREYASSALGPRSLSLSALFSQWGSCERGRWQHRILSERTRFTGLWRRLVNWGTEILTSRVPVCTTTGVERRGSGTAGAAREGIWSLTAFGVLALALFYMRWKHRQERFRLLLLIHEKDKMIAQLLQKIVQMNERSPQHVPTVTF